MKQVSTESMETREHILSVARVQFFKSGYAATSINSIVDATRFTKPTIYYHFKNKADLFGALIADAYDRCFDHRRTSIDAASSAREQVHRIVAADFEFCLSNPALVRFVIAQTFSLPEEKPVDLTATHSRDYEFLREIIEKGIASGEFICDDAGNAALALQGLIAINIMSYLKMGHEPQFLSRERADAVAELFLSGISSGKPRKGRRSTKIK
jgi:AcrR family transcriptional regulator